MSVHWYDLTEQHRKTRDKVRQYLGRAYTRRLLAAFSVLVDGEGLLKDHGCSDGALSEVCNAFRRIREEGNLDF